MKPRKLPSGKYQARIYVRRGGGVAREAVGTYATRKEAIKAAADAQHAYDKGVGYVDPEHKKLTVEEWANQWYALRSRPNRKVRSFLDAQIIPHFGAWRLSDVTSLAVQQWVNQLSAAGLAPATVRGMHATLRQMLGKAVDYEMLPKNPVKSIELPRSGEVEMVVLSVEQVVALEAAAPARFRAMVHLAAWAGLRWGELAALRWEDVDLEAGVIHVRRSVVTMSNPKGTTKTGRSRAVHVDPVVVETLRAHRRDFGSTELLFTTTRQSLPLDGSNWRAHTWAKLVAHLDPAPTPHDLRHFYAAQMVRAGMDWKVLADQMGHSKPSFSMDRYGWVRQDKRDVAIAALERARAL